jgi:hypothetical protein
MTQLCVVRRNEEFREEHVPEEEMALIKSILQNVSAIFCSP